jgi:hypothetical protein
MLRALGALLDAEQRKATPPEQKRGNSAISTALAAIKAEQRRASSTAVIRLPASLTARYRVEQSSVAADDHQSIDSVDDKDDDDDDNDGSDDDDDDDEEGRFVSMVDTPDSGVVASAMQAMLDRVLQLSMNQSDVNRRRR